jgi:glucosyl-dolichyl phosphate glucuronosyltransferase
MTMTPSLTSVVCTYNRYDLLAEAVESLLAQDTAPGSHEIIIVDNSPDHGRAAEEAERYRSRPSVRYLVERTAGLSNARNVGCRAASSPLVHYMDDDATAFPDLVAQLLAAFEAFGASVVGGQIIPRFAIPRPSWLHDDLLGFVSVVNWGGVARVASPSEWFAGANIAFRKSALEDAGLFNVGLGRVGAGHALLSNEEAELVERIRETGGIAVYAPDVTVRHLVEAERLTQSWFRRRTAWQAASEYLKSPKQTMAQSQAAWDRVLEYISALPPRFRNTHGLLLDTPDANLFRRQIDALYNMTVATLSGFAGVESYAFEP